MYVNKQSISNNVYKCISRYTFVYNTQVKAYVFFFFYNLNVKEIKKETSKFLPETADIFLRQFIIPIKPN